jgi:hypothetical protein
MSDKMMGEFQSGIEDSRKQLFAERTKMYEQLNITQEAVERTQQIEAKLQNMFISGTASGQ